MHFDLVDEVLEINGEGIVTLKSVTAAEEYLQDHFPTFPVLPGVLMIEALVQAARRWLAHTGKDGGKRYVLCGVKALKYGTFVRPGQAMRVNVKVHTFGEDGTIDFKGWAEVLTPGRPEQGPAPQSVSGRITMRPVRLTPIVR
jgi:3-hydroxyacyl-[acyl-carrier-protein] dehydratase